jgi:hypothetical protein
MDQSLVFTYMSLTETIERDALNEGWSMASIALGSVEFTGNDDFNKQWYLFDNDELMWIHWNKV